MRAKDPKFSAKEVRLVLFYDQKTGLFYKRKRDGSLRSRPLGSVMTLGYRRICHNNRLVLAHRLVWFYMTGKWPDRELDHINGEKDDNRFHNLRVASRSENLANRASQKGKKDSSIKGAYCDHRTGRWYSFIQKEKKRLYLGSFRTPEEANKAYAIAADNLYGEFARAN